MLSEKFFITETPIAKKYQKKAKLRASKNNFIIKNIKTAGIPIDRSPAKKKLKITNSESQILGNNFVNIRTSEHTSPTSSSQVLIGEKPSKKNKRVKSAFGNRLRDMATGEKGI